MNRRCRPDVSGLTRFAFKTTNYYRRRVFKIICTMYILANFFLHIFFFFLVVFVFFFLIFAHCSCHVTATVLWRARPGCREQIFNYQTKRIRFINEEKYFEVHNDFNGLTEIKKKKCFHAHLNVPLYNMLVYRIKVSRHVHRHISHSILFGTNNDCIFLGGIYMRRCLTRCGLRTCKSF